MSRVTLIGAPTDIGASTRGAGMGPEALRVAGLVARLRALGITVTDAGNLAGPPNPWRRPVRGHRHLREVTEWCQATHDAVLAALRAGSLPLLMGGDHSLAIGSVSALARYCREHGRRLRVIWLDAHADFNTARLTPSGNLHGMPAACLCGLGPAALTGLSGTVPALAPDDIRQVGIRSVDEGEKRLVLDTGLRVFDMRRIDELGMRAVMAQALAGLGPEDHLHLSFDVDFLDPAIAPGVGTPVRGGPDYREAQLCMEMIADTGRLGSVDLVELNPALDERNRSAELAVELMESLFGKRTLLRR